MYYAIVYFYFILVMLIWLLNSMIWLTCMLAKPWTIREIWYWSEISIGRVKCSFATLLLLLKSRPEVNWLWEEERIPASEMIDVPTPQSLRSLHRPLSPNCAHFEIGTRLRKGFLHEAMQFEAQNGIVIRTECGNRPVSPLIFLLYTQLGELLSSGVYPEEDISNLGSGLTNWT